MGLGLDMLGDGGGVEDARVGRVGVKTLHDNNYHMHHHSLHI